MRLRNAGNYHLCNGFYAFTVGRGAKLNFKILKRKNTNDQLKFRWKRIQGNFKLLYENAKLFILGSSLHGEDKGVIIFFCICVFVCIHLKSCPNI